MKSMIALLALTAACSAQVPYPRFYSYAPAYTYSNFGTPASTTKLNPATPIATPSFIAPHQYIGHAPFAAPAFNPYFLGFNRYTPFHAPATPFLNSPFVYSDVPAEVAPVAKDVAEVAEVAEVADIDVEEKPFLRRIFPIFSSDLRSGSTTVNFARPDQIDVSGDAAAIEGDDFVVVGAQPALRSNLAPNTVAYALPAGIAQATQPRFITVA